MRRLDSLDPKQSPLLAVAADALAANRTQLSASKSSTPIPLPPYRAADGAVYFVTFSPLDFLGWKIVTVIPEKDFLANYRPQYPAAALAARRLHPGHDPGGDPAGRLAAGPAAAPDRPRAAPHRGLPPRPNQSRVLALAGAGRSLRGDDADGPGPDLLPEVPADGVGAHPGLPGHRGQARRPAADPDRALRRSRRLHLALRAAGGGGRAGADPLSQQRLGCDRARERHHRQVHRRCGDGLLGRAQDHRASRRSRLPCRARLPRGPGPDPRARRQKAGPAPCICASASIPAPCWWAISGRRSG